MTEKFIPDRPRQDVPVVDVARVRTTYEMMLGERPDLRRWLDGHFAALLDGRSVVRDAGGGFDPGFGGSSLGRMS